MKFDNNLWKTKQTTIFSRRMRTFTKILCANLIKSVPWKKIFLTLMNKMNPDQCWRPNKKERKKAKKTVIMCLHKMTLKTMRRKRKMRKNHQISKRKTSRSENKETHNKGREKLGMTNGLMRKRIFSGSAICKLLWVTHWLSILGSTGKLMAVSRKWNHFFKERNHIGKLNLLIKEWSWVSWREIWILQTLLLNLWKSQMWSWDLRIRLACKDSKVIEKES